MVGAQQNSMGILAVEPRGGQLSFLLAMPHILTLCSLSVLLHMRALATVLG
jgi:hypothetical protein